MSESSKVVIVMVVLVQVTGYFYNMTNESQHHVLDKGKSAVLECEFHADSYNLFNNPVLWTKIQLNEQTHVNLLGNLNEPFASTNRFEVSFSASPPRYRFELSVLDVTLEDSANYTCEVKASNFIVLASMTHYVYVREEVRNLFLVQGKKPPFSNESSTIRAIEGLPIHLTCISLGGYPPPKVELKLAEKDVTDSFMSRLSAVTTGHKGMRRLTYRNERWTDDIRVDSTNDGNTLKCISTVPGFEPVHYEAHLEVLSDAPKVVCVNAMLMMEKDDVVLRCNITCKPPPIKLFWIVDDDNKTILYQHSQQRNIFVTNRDLGRGLIQSSLSIRSVTSEDLRKYTIVIVNKVGETSNQVEVKKKSRTQLHRNIVVSDSMSYHNNSDEMKRLLKEANPTDAHFHHYNRNHHYHDHRQRKKGEYLDDHHQLNSVRKRFSDFHFQAIVLLALRWFK